MSDDVLTGFLGLDEELRQYDTARAVVVPVPFEATTSYGSGTCRGPAEIIEASHQVEFFDEISGAEPCEMGIFTDEPIGEGADFADLAEALRLKAIQLINDQKFPLFVGGEHSVTPPIVEGIAERYPDLTVLHFDAHADLRDTYEGKPWSHACAMRRVFDLDIGFCSVAIRSLSREEYDLINEHNLNVFFAHAMRENPNWMDDVLARLSDTVYITFDIDAVDISEVRATGTPEPGGMVWPQIMAFFEKIKQSGKKIVGADLVELAPREDDHVSSFYAARLAYKLIGLCHL